MVKVRTCECCGHPCYATVGVDQFGPLLQGKQRKYFELVEKAGVVGISVTALIERLYADDPDGGPESKSIASVMAGQINKKIKGFGIAIQSTRGHHSVYRLVAT